MTNLQRLRLEQGLSQSQLASLAEVPVQYIQHLEIRYRNINKMALDRAIAIADALGCDVRDLMES